MIFEGSDLVCGQFFGGEGGGKGERLRGNGGKRGVDESRIGWGGCVWMLSFYF